MNKLDGIQFLYFILIKLPNIRNNNLLGVVLYLYIIKQTFISLQVDNN